MLCSCKSIHTTMIFFMTGTFITRYVPSKSDLPLDNTIIQYFTIMVQQYSCGKMVSQNICEMLLEGRVNLQENSHLYFCGILAIAQGYGDFSRSPLLCEFPQDLVLHVPKNVTAPLCSISLLPTYLVRWLLGTSSKNQPQK